MTKLPTIISLKMDSVNIMGSGKNHITLKKARDAPNCHSNKSTRIKTRSDICKKSLYELSVFLSEGEFGKNIMNDNQLGRHMSRDGKAHSLEIHGLQQCLTCHRTWSMVSNAARKSILLLPPHHSEGSLRAIPFSFPKPYRRLSVVLAIHI